MTGVVLASPSTGQLKAIMPTLNVYSDIRIEDVISFGTTESAQETLKTLDEEADMDREELKAHLENQDLKVDARLGQFEQRVTDGLSMMNQSLQLLDKDLAGVRGLKGTIILNSVVSVIAIVGIVIGVMAYGIANFDSGRDTSVLIQELRQQSFENKQMLEQIKANQKS
ncbi:hypothetical protein [Pseudomonas sp. LB3P58]